MRTFPAILLAIASIGMLIASPGQAQITAKATSAKQTPSQPAEKLSAEYVDLAGSQQNADALLVGLRTGKSITLTADPSGPTPAAAPATFFPATRKLGIGEINIALSLAKADLAKLGISNPTPAQLAAALNGGTITAANGAITTMPGVLAQRKSGMGWGDIANNMGYRLGELISASKTDKNPKGKSGEANAIGVNHASADGKPGQSHSESSGKSSGHGNSGGGNSGNGGGGGGGGGRGK